MKLIGLELFKNYMAMKFGSQTIYIYNQMSHLSPKAYY